MGRTLEPMMIADNESDDEETNMTLDEILNDFMGQIIEAVENRNDDTDQLLANIHTQAHNRLSGYNEYGELVNQPYKPLEAQAEGDE